MENDLYWEHEQHKTYTENCSTCWNENRQTKDLSKLTMDFFSNLYENQRRIIEGMNHD